MFYIFSIRYDTNDYLNTNIYDIFIGRKQFFSFDTGEHFLLQFCQDIDFCIKIKENNRIHIFIIFIEDESLHINNVYNLITRYASSLFSSIKKYKKFKTCNTPSEIINIASFEIDYYQLKNKINNSNNKLKITYSNEESEPNLSYRMLERNLTYKFIKIYHYTNFLMNYFSQLLPPELINIILKYLEIKIVIKFNLYKLKPIDNSYILRLPCFTINKKDLQNINSYNK